MLSFQISHLNKLQLLPNLSFWLAKSKKHSKACILNLACAVLLMSNEKKSGLFRAASSRSGSLQEVKLKKLLSL
jgi:hypothetical protein